ncbi:T9SS type A sorting domain-containing protein [bacterium]|nr:T9SS type A sorting domain-containing protein [bacterium]
MKKITIILSFLTFVIQANAQGLISQLNTDSEYTGPKCGSYHYMETVDHHHNGYLEHQNAQLQSIVRQVNQIQHKKADDEILTVEVVFHVVHNNNAENIPDSVLQNQLDLLNRSFRRMNADTSNLRSQFKPHVGDSYIEFKLAEEDPDGLPTNGIVRTQTPVEYFGGVLPYGQGQTVKIQKWVADSFYYNLGRISRSDLGGSDPWDPTRYLNIWIGDLRIYEPQFNDFKELIFFALATPPRNHASWADYEEIEDIQIAMNDGVFVHYNVPGPNNPSKFESPYNAYEGIVTGGKIMVHEVGHYLGLRHIWGDGGCNNDDFMDDTPLSNNSSQFGCNSNRNSCVDDIDGVDLPDMIENYMDYSSYACMNSFTKDQIAVMRAVVRDGRGFVVSVEEPKPELGMTIYPNPNTGSFRISIDQNTKVDEVKIYNTEGKLINISTLNTNNNIELDLQPGLYFVEVRVEGVVSRKRVVVM